MVREIFEILSVHKSGVLDHCDAMGVTELEFNGTCRLQTKIDHQKVRLYLLQITSVHGTAGTRAMAGTMLHSMTISKCVINNKSTTKRLSDYL